VLRQRGFIQLTLFGWVVVAAAIAFAGLTAAVTVQTKRLAWCKQEHAVFVGKTEALGKQAEADAAVRKLKDMKNKERTDEEVTRRTAALNATIAGLRNERARGSFVPAAPAASGSPDRAAFDRAELERAIRGLDQGVQGLVDEGSAAVIKLDESRRWAQERR
jgi:hypothetical protein